ncbi:MAG: c-type cytochrome [bacterium]
MNTKYLYNKKFIIVSILLILLVITGIYLLFGISSNKTDAMGMMGSSGGMNGMMGNNGMMGMGNDMNMTGKGVNSMGHRMFPQYKGVKTGPALFRYEGCFMCHTINGSGGDGMAPNLSHIGSVRSFSWIATQIADPSAHFKRNSVVTLNGAKYKAVMPSFKNMSSKDIGILAKYLESLK